MRKIQRLALLPLLFLLTSAKNFGPDLSILDAILLLIAFILLITLIPFGPFVIYWGLIRKTWLTLSVAALSTALQLGAVFVALSSGANWMVVLFFSFLVVLSFIMIVTGWKKVKS
ncbi:MAG: hypothetical protein JNM95_02680 [Chitinophagaceae bacterium]|nr:hypothetical protein [Chitinophagaceae bacterium]